MAKELPSKQLSEEHKAFIIKKLALKEDYIKIKEEFAKFFDCIVDGETIIKVENTYALVIHEVAQRELNNIAREPLAHARIRLRILHEALKDAMVSRIIKSSQVGENDWEVERGMNLAAIDRIVKNAREEEFFAKKLLLEVKKLKLEAEKEDIVSTGFSVQINDGLDE